jgi:hypothetical protein
VTSKNQQVFISWDGGSITFKYFLKEITTPPSNNIRIRSIQTSETTVKKNDLYKYLTIILKRESIQNITSLFQNTCHH